MEGASDQYLLPASFTQYVLLLSKLWNRQTFILNSVMHVLLLRLCYATVMKDANVHLYRHCSRRQHFSPVICMLCSQNSYGACKYYFLNNLNMCALLKIYLKVTEVATSIFKQSHFPFKKISTWHSIQIFLA